MALYEHVFIVRQDVGTGQVETLTEQFSNIITENGGKVEKTEYWGLKTMAYKIKKNRKGHYTLLNVDAPSAALHELERQQRISDDVIRYLTVKVDELEEDPSAMMRSKGRDDRGPRGPRPPFRNDGGDKPGDSPKAESPKADSPKDESPKTDSPKTDSPKADSPKADSPKADSSKDESVKDTAKEADTAKVAADKPETTDAPKTTEAKED